MRVSVRRELGQNSNMQGRNHTEHFEQMLGSPKSSVRTMCCILVSGSGPRAHQPSASLCDETSSDSSYQSLRMLRLLLSAAPVQGSDGTVRITVLATAMKCQPGRLVIEPG